MNLFAKSEDTDDRAYVNLAERQIRRIKSEQGPGENQSVFVLRQLDRAESLVEEGKLIEARRLLDSLVSLYDGNQELQPHIDRARQQIRELGGNE